MATKVQELLDRWGDPGAGGRVMWPRWYREAAVELATAMDADSQTATRDVAGNQVAAVRALVDAWWKLDAPISTNDAARVVSAMLRDGEALAELMGGPLPGTERQEVALSRRVAALALTMDALATTPVSGQEVAKLLRETLTGLTT